MKTTPIPNTSQLSNERFTDTEAGPQKIIAGTKTRNLSHLHSTFIQQCLASHGVVLFRGFNSNLNSFPQLVNRCSQKTTIDPGRKALYRHTQLVNQGHDPIGMHCENGNAPRIPDVLWLYCERAPTFASQTTFCDGQRVWQRLPTQEQRLFSAQPLKLCRQVPESCWKRYVFHELEHLQQLDDVRFHHLYQLKHPLTQCHFSLAQDQSIFMEVITPAVHPSRFSPYSAFANSLFGPAQNLSQPDIRFANNHDIPPDALAAVTRAIERETQQINWHHGDIVVIDNTRYMHGRRAVVDINRKIHVAMSYLPST